MGTQLDSFPRLIRSYQAFPGQKSAYARGRAIADDGVAYIVKPQAGDRPICAIEWICTSLAESLNLPVPTPKILKMPDGQLVFGSAEIANRLPDYEVAELLLTGRKSNAIQTTNLRSLLSRILAFDLFIGNFDKHAENILMAISVSDDAMTRMGNLVAIDFDSADIVTRENIRLPMHPSSHTLKLARQVHRHHQFDNQPADDMLTRLIKGRDFMFDQATNGLPPQWLSASARKALLNRVHATPFEEQIRQLQQGLSNGSYL